MLVEHRARGVTSTEVKGRFAPLDALAVLLANTGLDYRLTDNGIVVFQPIAQVLNVPVGTIKSRLFRARRMLRDAMQERRDS